MKSLIYFEMIIVICFCSSSVKLYSQTEELHEELESVVRVISEKGNLRHYGTGFLWQDKSTVITSFHVVAGSERIYVYPPLEDGVLGKPISASISKIKSSSDLVLLTLNGKLEKHVITDIGNAPKTWDKLFSRGFPMKNTLSRNISLDVSNPTQKLKRVAPKGAVRSNLKKLKYLDLNMKVIHLDGNLMPGESGSPVLDKEGELVGVVFGGLEEGALGYCWAVHAQEIRDLLSSTESIEFAQNPELWNRIEGVFGAEETMVGKNFILGISKLGDTL